MFKLAKYYLLVHLYKRAKFSVVLVLVSLMLMLITSLVFVDLMAMAKGSAYVLLVVVKWFILFGLLGFVLYHIAKILRSASNTWCIAQSKVETLTSKKKAQPMNKEKLRSRSDLVLEKYRKTK